MQKNVIQFPVDAGQRVLLTRLEDTLYAVLAEHELTTVDIIGAIEVMKLNLFASLADTE